VSNDHSIEDNKSHLVTEKIRKEWPLWDQLHEWWGELPNYSPIAVSDSSSGQNYADQAADVFSTTHNQRTRRSREVDAENGDSSGSDEAVESDEEDQLAGDDSDPSAGHAGSGIDDLGDMDMSSKELERMTNVCPLPSLLVSRTNSPYSSPAPVMLKLNGLEIRPLLQDLHEHPLPLVAQTCVLLLQRPGLRKQSPQPTQNCSRRRARSMRRR
jgi:hypothetical protein